MATCASARSVDGFQLAYEPFTIGAALGEYQVGPLVGQPAFEWPDTFFSGPWIGSGGHSVALDSIITSPWPSEGGHVTSAGDSRAARRLTEPWGSTTTGTFYVGWLSSFGSPPAEAPDGEVGYRATEFWQPTGGDVLSGAPIGYVGYNQFGTGPDMRRMMLAFGGERVILDGAPDTLHDDEMTHLLVLKFELTAAPGGDKVSAYLDPWVGFTDSGGGLLEPDTPDAEITGLNLTLGAIGATAAFGASGTSPQFDELRVATTFEEAVPTIVPGDIPCVSDFGYACFLVISANMHQNGIVGPEQGDIALANGKPGFDGRVTIADYRLWRNNYLPEVIEFASLSIPEPASFTLIVAIVAMAAVRLRRRAR